MRNAFTHAQDIASPLRLRTIRVFLAFGIGWSILALSICLNSPVLATAFERCVAALIPAGMALILAWGFLRFESLDYGRAVSTSSWVALACVGIVATASGRGIHSHAIGLVGLILCGHGVTLGLRLTLPMALAAIVMEGGLYAAEHLGFLPGVTDRTRASDGLIMLAHAMNLTSGISVGLMGWAGAEILRRRGHRESNRLSAMLRVVADAYWEQDAQQRFTHWSLRDGAAPLLAPQLVIGKTLAQIQPWQLSTAQAEAFAQCVRERLPIHRLVFETHTAQDGVQFISLSGEPRYNEAGEFVGYWGIGQDVTDDQEVVRALAASEAEQRRSQALLTQLFAAGADAIAVVDLASGTYSLVNNSFTRISGYGAQEVVGRPVADVAIWHNPNDLLRLMRGINRDGTAAELPSLMRTKAGETRTIQLSPSRFDMDGRDYLVVSARDITEVERVRLEHEAMLRHAPVGVVFARHWLILHSNLAFERMFGWPEGTSKGRHVSAVWAAKEDYEQMNERATPRLARGEAVEFDIRAVRADGTPFWCRIAGRVIDPSDPSRGGVIWIAEDVTERRRIDEALALSRDAAEAANRAKSAFLANTSHELRTPLNAMVGLAQLAQARDLDETRRQRYLAQMVESGKVLTGIISDVLDLAKVEAGKLRLEHRAFSLHGAAQGLHDAYAPLAQAKGLSMTLTMAPDLADRVMGDAMRLRQILANLLANAIKFTASGTVGLSVRPQGTSICFEVSDTGPGIAVDTLATLFQPFSQGDASTTRRFGGTGLGLAICQELVTLMGGSLGVHSQPGQGSVFWAEIPLPAAPLAAPPMADAQSGVSGDGSGGPALAGVRVLVVEDNEVNMLITTACLEQWGMQVLPASDGHDALAMLRSLLTAGDDSHGTPVDLVLMDLQMPGMSGFEATRAIHALPGLETLPVIALTAAALVDERQRAFDAGMTAFLTKPIQAEALQQALRLSLGYAQATEAQATQAQPTHVQPIKGQH